MAPAATGKKRVYVIRHGQSTYNAATDSGGPDPMLFDAELTGKGVQQAKALQAQVKELPIEVVFSSPLRRAIQTTLHAFENHPNKPPVEIVPYHREFQESSCDVGSPASELAALFPALDFEHLEEIWWTTGPVDRRLGFPTEDRRSLQARIQELKKFIASRPERTIALVGHWTFWYTATGHSLNNAELAEWKLDWDKHEREYNANANRG
eukprot:tig00020780_g13799.t1